MGPRSAATNSLPLIRSPEAVGRANREQNHSRQAILPAGSSLPPKQQSAAIDDESIAATGRGT
ncbi:hypothetical protein RRSWK_04182 [Rhodopirellula sp. SWK7]|nr:hypothetical protein RRSWK_04182 [Rhodopirellula sp. SWK7]